MTGDPMDPRLSLTLHALAKLCKELLAKKPLYDDDGGMTDAIELDPRRLRALAHPLRVRLLGLLRTDGPATATLLAKRVGESSGATSYHLRQLAAYGFVEDDPERGGAGRQRWWRSTHTSTEWRDADSTYDAEPHGVLDDWSHQMLRAQLRQVERWLAERTEWDKSWVEAADLSGWTLRLTAEQLAGLRDELHAILTRYGDLPAGPGAEQVVVNLHAVPRPMTRPDRTPREGTWGANAVPASVREEGTARPRSPH
jgi:DNA-binding transcriptional ArsR family regulator